MFLNFNDEELGRVIENYLRRHASIIVAICIVVCMFFAGRYYYQYSQQAQVSKMNSLLFNIYENTSKTQMPSNAGDDVDSEESANEMIQFAWQSILDSNINLEHKTFAGILLANKELKVVSKKS